MIWILVVDDVPEQLDDLEEEVYFSLRDFQIEVEKALDIQAAEILFERRLKESNPYDVVILDLNLPSIDQVTEEGGWYLLRRFAERSPNTTYILSSGHPSDSRVLPADFPVQIELKYHCIPKAAPRKRLIELLRKVLGQARPT